VPSANRMQASRLRHTECAYYRDAISRLRSQPIEHTPSAHYTTIAPFLRIMRAKNPELKVIYSRPVP
jgi:hypothetical protein